MNPFAGVDRRDVALSVAVVVVGQIDVVFAPELFGTNIVGPRWVVSLTYLVAAAALLLRRTRPGVAFTLFAGALMAQALTAGTSEGNGALLPALVLSYSVAVHGSRRTAIAALCAIPVLATIRELANPDNTTAAEVFNGIGWDLTLVAAWLLGAWIRTRRQLVAELRQRAADAATTATLAERTRVARELHDVLAHSLGIVVVQAEAAEEALDRRPELAARSLQAIQRTGREALVEVRRVVGVLRDDETVLSPLPGAGAVGELVDRMRDAGLRVDLDVRGAVDTLPAAPGLAVYRVVQEAMTNILKHAEASTVRVLIDRGPDRVFVEVVDDGLGGPVDLPPGSGSGLRGMRERVAALGGSFSAGSLEDHGFAVRAVLSLEEPS